MTPDKQLPWDLYAYGFTLVVAVFMFAMVLFFISTHCEQVLSENGGTTCGIGIGWILACLAFIIIAAYSAWQIFLILGKETRVTGD